MSRAARAFRRSLLPGGIFLAVLVVHCTWSGFYPERDPAQARWVALAAPTGSPWLQGYIESQNYWLGLSYALSLAFAATSFRRYREERRCSARNLAVGGVTLSGVLAVAGCYLVGCCGSPMLALYLNLFGASFVPLAKPLVAGLTAVCVIGAWAWMNHSRRAAGDAPFMACPDERCARGADTG